MSEKVGGIYIEASIDTTGAIQAGKAIAKTADEIAADMQRIGDAADKASKGQDRLAQSAIQLAKAQAQAAAQSEKAASASQSITQKLQNQRDSVDAYINALKVQNETLGLSQSELNSYRLAKLAASDAEQKIAANLQSQIDAYHQNMAAVEASKNQQLQNKNTIEQMVVALREQSATLGMNARQLILYKAAQAGASVEDKKSIIQSLNQIEAYRRKEEATRKATAALQASTAAQGVAQGSMRSLRGVAGNLGFQLQDIAVQAQMGTNAFVILGQQGSQVASAFGPGGAVIGAVIAVAAAIGGVLFTSLNKTSAEIKEEFLPNVKDLKENLDQISKSQASVAIQQIQKDMEPLPAIAKAAAAQVEYLTKQIDKYPSNKEAKKWNEELEIQKGILDGVNQKMIELNKDNVTFLDIIKRNINGTQGQQEADKKRIETLKDLLMVTEQQAAIAGKTPRGIALYAAEQVKATAAEIARINAAYNVIEAEEKKKDVTKAGAKEDDAKTKALNSIVNGLNEQYQKLTMNADAYEEYAAVQQAVAAGATPATIAGIREKIKALQDERKAIQENSDLQDEIAENVKFEEEEKKKITTEFASVQTGIQGDLETPAQKAKTELDARLAVIKEYNGLFSLEEARRTEAGIAAEQAYQNKITEITKSQEIARLDAQRNLLNQTLSMTETVFGNIASAVENAKGRESTAFKVAFLAQKAAAIAMAVLQIELAAASALAPPPFGLGPVAGLPYAQFIRGVGYTGVGIMTAQTIAGGRLYGGPVQAGGMYPVTEDGRPEILKQGNRQYLLPGSQGGEVISNKDMQQTGGGGGITINYNPTIYAQQTDFETIMAGQPEAVLNAVRAGLASEGRTL